MARPIPEGYELLSGRSPKNARKAMSLAEERGVDSSHVLTQTDGYLVPLGPESHIHSAEAPAGPVGDPIAGIEQRQVAEAIVEEVELPTESNTVAEIDDFANTHGIEVSGTKAEKVAEINRVFAERAEANDKHLAETGELRSSDETKED